MSIPRMPLVYVSEQSYNLIRSSGKVNGFYNLCLPEHSEQLAQLGAKCAFVFDCECLPVVVNVTRTYREQQTDTGPFDCWQSIEGTVNTWPNC